MLDFPLAKGKILGKGDVKNRSISLFSEVYIAQLKTMNRYSNKPMHLQVPKERTCENAGIEPHWCACLSWHELQPGEDAIAQKAAIALVDRINQETQANRKICTNLQLQKLLWAGRFQPHKGLLQFQKNADLDGFKADLSAHTEVTQLLYQVINGPTASIYFITGSLLLALDIDIKPSHAGPWGDIIARTA